jgi:transposase
LSDFERGQIISGHLAGASITKTSTLLGVLKATVSEVMSAAYTNHGKTASAKRNNGRKSTLTERYHHILRENVSKNHRTTATHVAAELNNHLEDHLSTKTVQHELHKSNIHNRAVTAKPLITESNAQMHK